MSFTLMAQAIKIKTGNPARKLILLKLADIADDNGICWPSYAHIADQCEMTRRSAIAHIDALIKDGYLIKTTRKISSDLNHSNKYQLVLHAKNSLPSEKITLPSEKITLPSEKITLPSEKITLPSENISPPHSENISPLTYHSLDTTNDTINNKCESTQQAATTHTKKSNSKLEAKNELEQKLIDYRKEIKKPLKTPRGLGSLVKAIHSAATAWNCSVDKVTDYMMEKEWQSIRPDYANPFVKAQQTGCNTPTPDHPKPRYFTPQPVAAQEEIRAREQASTGLNNLRDLFNQGGV